MQTSLISEIQSLETDINYAEFHLTRAQKAASLDPDYPDDYLRIVDWLDDAYNRRGYLQAKKAISEFLGKPIEVARVGYERLKWKAEPWTFKKTGKTVWYHVVRNEYGHIVSRRVVSRLPWHPEVFERL